MRNGKTKVFLDQKGASKLALIIVIVGVIAIISVFTAFSILPTINKPNSLSLDDAKRVAQDYVNQFFGSDLEIHEIMEFSNNFYVVVQEEDTGINAFELLVDQYSGSVTPEPGPNMMWNTKYQMGRHHNIYSGEMTIDPKEAATIAQDWLNIIFLDSTPTEPMRFYGYYTFDFVYNDKTVGMLSVNGYSGEVWYHNWHGQFITSQDYS